ncbi:MAG: AMP-binding protein [Acidobacteria bacterium]|nr:AMP-binding protein [Acidobacteriota bacterium]MDA1234280.1 AMP-binding protein [Acidobacteriota bacterium]
MALNADLPLDREGLQSHQLACLQKLLAAIVPANPFYTRKLAEAGISAGLASLEEYIARAPFTLKQELVEDQLQNLPYGTNLTYLLENYTRQWQTSGTSGQPMRWLDTAESISWMLDSWELVYRSAGVTSEDRVFFAFSFGPFLGFWTAYEAAGRMGCLCLPGGGMSSSARIRAIIDSEMTVLCCTPTYAMRLAEVAASDGVDLAQSKVRRIIVAGEPGGGIPATRARIESLWPGAKIVDHHGMTEVGPVSYECPEQPGVLHIIESAYFPEVIDQQKGEAIEPGGTGELVLTNLGRTGSPLLRYRTGDLVKLSAAERCTCGAWDMALEGGILGRCDDMVVVRGVNVFPSAVEEVVRSCGGVAEYCVESRTVRSLTELVLQIEPEPQVQDASELAGRLEVALRDAFGLRITAKVVSPGDLPRFEMKARRWRKI